MDFDDSGAENLDDWVLNHHERLRMAADAARAAMQGASKRRKRRYHHTMKMMMIFRYGLIKSVKLHMNECSFRGTRFPRFVIILVTPVGVVKPLVWNLNRTVLRIPKYIPEVVQSLSFAFMYGYCGTYYLADLHIASSINLTQRQINPQFFFSLLNIITVNMLKQHSNNRLTSRKIAANANNGDFISVVIHSATRSSDDRRLTNRSACFE